MAKKALIAASFGSSHTPAWEKAMLPLEKRLAQSFPEYELTRVFLSQKIIRILDTRDVRVENPAQAMERCYQAGYEELLIQPLLVIAGIEYERLIAEAQCFKDKFTRITIGSPLLSSADDFEQVVKFLQNESGTIDTDALLLMGHGSEHQANAAYTRLNTLFTQNGIENLFLATVEGKPSLADLLPLLQQKRIQSLTLMPFMLVAGDHAQNDMAGDHEQSWKSLLEKEGFRVDVRLSGLGEVQAIQQQFINHALDGLKQDAI